MSKIAFLGTGLLGSALAEAACNRGDTVTVWNRSHDKLMRLADFGAELATSAEDAVRGATRVHLTLRDDAAVESVLSTARNGLAAHAVVIDHSTTLPCLTAERSARLNLEGVNYLHCPVFMSPQAARLSQGRMLVSGPVELFESVKSELEAMTSSLEYMGERGDLAAVHKLFGNSIIIGMTALMADVLTIANESDVRYQDAIKLLANLDFQKMIDGRGISMANGDFSPNFELTMARKDIELLLQAAGEKTLSVLPFIAKRMDQLIAEGHGASDCCVLGIDAVKC